MAEHLGGAQAPDCPNTFRMNGLANGHCQEKAPANRQPNSVSPLLISCKKWITPELAFYHWITPAAASIIRRYGHLTQSNAARRVPNVARNIRPESTCGQALFCARQALRTICSAVRRESIQPGKQDVHHESHRRGTRLATVSPPVSRGERGEGGGADSFPQRIAGTFRLPVCTARTRWRMSRRPAFNLAAPQAAPRICSAPFS